MTSRERVTTVYGFKQPDRLPFTELSVNQPVASKLLGREAWTGFGGYVRGKLHNTLLAQGRRDEYVDRFITDTLETLRILEFDIIPVNFMPARGGKHPIIEIAENVWKFDWGETWSVQRWQPSNDFYGEEDSSFDRDPEKELKAQIAHLKRRERRVPREGELDFFRRARVKFPDAFLWGGAGFGIPYSEAGLTSLLEYTDLWRERCELEVEGNIQAIDIQIDEGVDAFWDGSDWAFKTRPLISPALFREIFLKPYKAVVDYIHSRGMKFIKHTDGNINCFEEMWFGEIGMDGYHAIEPTAGMDILALRARWPKLLLHGNLDCGRLLTLGSPEEIEAEVVRLVRGLAPKSGYVFSSSNSIHSGVPVENLKVMLAAVKKHGVYPIAQ